MKNYKLVEIIDSLISLRNFDFTGLGLIIYKDLNNLPIESMNGNCHVKKLNDPKLIADKLINISKKNNNCHDGFHLLNEDFELLGLSYYFSTPISKLYKPSRVKGSRYRTAFYGSLLRNVLCTVSISSGFEVFIFINGKEFTLEEYRLL